MGANGSSGKYYVQIVHCGACGWAGPANQLVKHIKSKTSATVDCKAETKYTGTFEVFVVNTEGKSRQKVFSGDKKQLTEDFKQITDKILTQFKQIQLQGK